MKTAVLLNKGLLKKGLLLATLALTTWALAASADDPEVERHIQLKIVADDEMLDLDLSNLEVGETEQLFTESGKQVVILRTDEDYEIDVEGRDEPIIVKTGDHAYAFAVDHECDGSDDDCLHHVVVHKNIHMVHGDGDHGDGEGLHTMVFMGEDGESHSVGGHANVWISADGEGEGHGEGMRVFNFAGGEGAVEKLLASGALDSLDGAKREEILEALRNGHGSGDMQIKVIKKHRHEEDQ